LRQFATRVGYSFGQISKVEQGTRRANRDFAERCDLALNAGGALVEAWIVSAGLVRPSQLPPAPARLEGRLRQLAELDAAITGRAPGAPAVVVIDGPAGAGKTALALYRAHRATDQFIDGQLYADLQGFAPRTQSPATPDTVLTWFCQALRATHIPETLQEKTALFRSLLHDRRVLIVLDNAASAEQVEPILPAAEGCAVVITSRRVLSRLAMHYDARRVTVGPLAADDSVRLLQYLIGNQRAEDERDAVRRLATLCGNLPLALRIAADLVCRHPHRQIADLAAELDDQEGRIDGLETDDDRTLRAVLSWSYQVLPEGTARMFRYLGLHEGSTISISAAAALTGESTLTTRQAIRQLASLHLAEMVSSEAITMHELVRDYARVLAREQLTAEERRIAADGVAEWYEHVSRAAG
jgi:hypothetical protein